MVLSEHFRKRRDVYRVVSAVCGLAVLLGWGWGTHPAWWLWAAVVYAWGAFVPEIEVPPAKIALLVLMAPTLALLWDRGGFGHRPWSLDANFLYEVGISIALAWPLLAILSLTFFPRMSDRHAI